MVSLACRVRLILADDHRDNLEAERRLLESEFDIVSTVNDRLPRSTTSSNSCPTG